MRSSHDQWTLGLLALCLFLLFASVGVAQERAESDSLETSLATAERALAEQRPLAVMELLEPLLASHRLRVAPMLLAAYRAAERNDAGRALVESLLNQSDIPPQTIVAVAQWEAEEGWVRRAERRLTDALAAHPNSISLRLARSRLRASIGELDGAWTDLEAALAAGAEAEAVAWLRGSLAIDRGDEEQGRRWLLELIERQPGHLAARLALARADRRQRSEAFRAAAIEGYWSILERDPHHAAALGELGSLLVRSEATRRIGEALLRRFREIRDRRERIDRLRREIREGRDEPATRIELAKALRKDRSPRAARPVLIPVESFPAELQSAAFAELGLISRAIADRRGALAAFGAALKRDPARDDLRLEIAEVLLELGDPRRALKTLERAGGRLESRRAQWVRLEGLARGGAGWDELGSRLWDHWREDPTDWVAARAYVDAAIGLGREGDARLRVDTALERTTGSESERATLLWAHAEFHRAVPLDMEASRDLEDRLLRGAPDSLEALIWVADRCRKRRDLVRAEELLQRARRLRAWRD